MKATPSSHGLRRLLSGSMLVAAVGGCALWFVTLPIRGVISYDKKTTELGKRMGDYTSEQWRNIYRESEEIFRSRPDPIKKTSLSDAQLPLRLRGLGFDRCYVNNEGVFYLRIGGGWSDGNATQVHCIFSPDMIVHDRKGIWLDGFRTFEWVFEPETQSQSKQ